MASLKDKSAKVIAKAVAAVSAMVSLYAYQKAWITDEARFKIAIKGRQEGFTFAATLRHVRRRLATKGTTIWISGSERQSKEAVEFVRTHCAALKELYAYEEIEFPGTDEKALQVTFKHNGARFIAMPANPDTVRTFSGDVVLDEFAFHRDAMKIWRAAMAMASRGYHVEVISTPNGQQGKYWDICRQVGVDPHGSMDKQRWTSGIWSVHWIDVYAAVKAGCPINIAELREAAGDEDTFLQEYCCVFLADAENFIPLELIIANESSDATLALPLDFVPRGDMYLGGDIGRKKDRSVFWLDEKLGDVMYTRAVIILERTPFAAQEAQLDLLMPMVRRACLDSTGLGMQLAENQIAKHGSKVEAIEFNIANKEAMATLAKRELEERRCRIPYAPFIRRSINAVKRYSSPTGHFRFDAERTEQGHADEFWAFALAKMAGSAPTEIAIAGSSAELVTRSPRQGVMSSTARDLIEVQRSGILAGGSSRRDERRSLLR